MNKKFGIVIFALVITTIVAFGVLNFFNSFIYQEISQERTSFLSESELANIFENHHHDKLILPTHIGKTGGADSEIIFNAFNHGNQFSEELIFVVDSDGIQLAKFKCRSLTDLHNGFLIIIENSTQLEKILDNNVCGKFNQQAIDLLEN
jgi:hypothetical protein